MRIAFPLAAATLALGLAAPAFAQSGATQSPPSPNSGASAPSPSNSAPAGSMTTDPTSPGGASPTMGAQTGTTGMAQPVAPSGSTGNNPSSAFDRTVPQPSPSATGTAR